MRRAGVSWVWSDTTVSGTEGAERRRIGGMTAVQPSGVRIRTPTDVLSPFASTTVIR
jgi:hypothetical protein